MVRIFGAEYLYTEKRFLRISKDRFSCVLRVHCRGASVSILLHSPEKHIKRF